MSWITENWPWVMVFVAFVSMHMFGHGGHHGQRHGGHGRGDRPRNTDNGEEADGRGAANRTSDGRQH